MEKISLDKISVENKYLRLDTDIDGLKESILKLGVIHPLTLNRENKLLAGGRRYSALKELGMTEAPVVFVDENEIIQELISIDENLVRKPLVDTELEACLRRGKELYEKLNPDAVEEYEEMTKKISPRKVEQPEDPGRKKTFVQDTAERTGLSEMSIRKAIRRDVELAPRLKEARDRGELKTSQADQLIKLNEKEQEEILPYVKDKASSAIKNIIKIAQTDGIQKAINESLMDEVPREVLGARATAKRLNGLIKNVMDYDLDENEVNFVQMKSHLQLLHSTLGEFFEQYEVESGKDKDFHLHGSVGSVAADNSEQAGLQ